MVNYDIVPRSNRVVGGGMPSRSGICAGVALGTLIAVPLLAATPKLTPVQAAALFKAAGFPIGADKHPVNRCGQQADPRVLFDDMNDDGRAEAIFIDQGDCYKPDGLWYAVATADADGAWRRVLDGEVRLKSTGVAFTEIGRASCRERVCQYV